MIEFLRRLFPNRSKKEVLYQTALDELRARLKSIEYQPFTSQQDNDFDAVIEFEKAFQKLSKRTFASAFLTLFDKTGTQGYWKVDNQICVRCWGPNNLLRVMTFAGKHEHLAFGIHPDGRIFLGHNRKDGLSFTQAVLTIQYILLRAEKLNQ